MRIFGLTVTRTKTGMPQPVYGYGQSYGFIHEPFAGAWQQNMSQRPTDVLTYSAVYACITLIASDIGKLGLRLVQQDADEIWTPVKRPNYSPVLKKPNRYQTRIKFVEHWIVSKLIHGNTYVLKQRDENGFVIGLYILDPTRTRPAVAPDGSIFYQIGMDNLSGITSTGLMVPASEIIHDIMVALYHPLCGVSPLTACGLAAIQGLRIQENSSAFFANGSKPGGILTAPGMITEPTAERLKRLWEENYGGKNYGRVAVLGDGLKYETMSVNAVDAQLIEQLKWTAEQVCTAFHVPPYMIGVGPLPTLNNIEALAQQYYSQCLQTLIESFELCLDEGLSLPELLGTEFNLDDLLRMDSATKIKSAMDGVTGGIFAPNEARKRFDLKPVKGGDTPYLQQQNFSLAALDARDRSADPFGKAKTEPPAPTAPAKQIDNVTTDDVIAALNKKFAEAPAYV